MPEGNAGEQKQVTESQNGGTTNIPSGTPTTTRSSRTPERRETTSIFAMAAGMFKK